jgi:heptosyltransferase-2
LTCRPCGTHGRNYCPTGTHACQTRIQSESVFNAIMELLETD